MITDINELYQTLNSYMDIQEQITDDDYADYETDIIIDKSLYNKNTFDLIINNICNAPNNKLIEYDPESLGIHFMRGNTTFDIDVLPSVDEINDIDEDELNDIDYIIYVEIRS